METLTQGPEGPKSNFLRSVEEVTHACQTVKGIVSSDLLVTRPSDRIVISYSTQYSPLRGDPSSVVCGVSGCTHRDHVHGVCSLGGATFSI